MESIIFYAFITLIYVIRNVAFRTCRCKHPREPSGKGTHSCRNLNYLCILFGVFEAVQSVCLRNNNNSLS